MQGGTIPWGRLACCGILVLRLLTPIASWVDPSCAKEESDELSKAQADYESARFEEAILRLEELTRRVDLTDSERLVGMEFLARSYVRVGNVTAARRAFKKIVELDPSWRPDEIRVPPDEREVFFDALDESLREVERDSTATAVAEAPIPVHKGAVYKRWWFWVCVAVISGVITWAAIDGEDEPGRLPEFPDPPGM